MGVHTDNCGCGGTGSGGTTPGTPGNEFAQNNVGRKLNAGIFTIAPVASNMYEYAVTAKVADYFNTLPITITEIETPVIVYVIIFTAGGLGSKRHKLLFLKGRGVHGLGGNQIFGSDFEITTTQNLLISDMTDGNAYTVTIDLGNLPDGDYLTAANSAEREFIDATKTYFITYNKDNKAYLLKFEGELGYYGGSYPDDFIMENFLPASDSDVEPDVTKTSQLVNDGADGFSPYATEAELNSFSLIVNQATASLYLRNYEGVNIAAVNLAFLNNEGTTFFYEESTQMLQLKNDSGEILSSIPVSAFVANLMSTVDFNAVTPHLLEFKDATGNVVDSVTVTINNVQGLQVALNNKVNRDGSNAVQYSNWPINVLGAATADQFGDAYGDFLNDGTGQTHAVGYDSANNKVKRYTGTSFKLWLAIAMTDVAGLSTAFANVTSALADKANKDGSNATGNWNINVLGSAQGWNSLLRQAGNIVDPPQFITMNADGTNAGNTNAAQVKQALGINGKANLNGGNTFTGNNNIIGDVTVGEANEIPVNRKVIKFAVGGYGSPGAFNGNSNGDKVILYQGSDYDGRIGIGDVGNIYIKSYSISGGGGFEVYVSSSNINSMLAFRVTGAGKVKAALAASEYDDVVRLLEFNNGLSAKADLVLGRIPASQLPAYVDDVLEYANLAAFPAAGEIGKIYVTLDTNLTYRWSGTAYVEISKSIAIGDTAGSAGRGDHTKTAYDHTFIGGNPHGTAIADIPGLGVTLDGIIAGTAYEKNYTYTGSSSWFSTLNSQYPGAVNGFTVYAFDTVGGSNVVCKKLEDEWAIITGLSGFVSGS